MVLACSEGGRRLGVSGLKEEQHILAAVLTFNILGHNALESKIGSVGQQKENHLQ